MDAGGGAAVEVRVDGGDWGAAACDPPAGPYALTRWRARVELTPGGRTIAVRATDGAGRSQPETPLGNPRGDASASVQDVDLGDEIWFRGPPLSGLSWMGPRAVALERLLGVDSRAVGCEVRTARRRDARLACRADRPAGRDPARGRRRAARRLLLPGLR